MAPLSTYQHIIVKIGSALIVDEATGKLNDIWLNAIASDIAKQIRNNVRVTIVSSGAVALGRTKLGLNSSPLTLTQKQACAAAGQVILAQSYAHAFGKLDITTAQALLTLNDTENRRRYINAKATLETLLSLAVIPIINENDTVATDEIRYGDNDRLAARVAQMLGADLLVLLSDIDGLYTKDPNVHADASRIPIVKEITKDIIAMGGPPNQGRGTGSGGMATKLKAAQIATRAGCELGICKGDTPNPLSSYLDNSRPSTRFLPATNGDLARKKWIAASLKPKGQVKIDDGARGALKNGKSLLVAGVIQVDGAFEKGDAIDICDANNLVIARGLSAYGAQETHLIKGLRSEKIECVLGYKATPVLIHRDNMVQL